jgi:LacI family transcriptional regulator
MAGMRWVAEAFDKWPDLSGFYNVGGGNSGVFDGLRNLDRKVFFVGHELSDSATAALQDGTADIIFDQLPETQARRSLDIILSKLGYIETTVTNPPIRFATITAENI